ncbi:MAG: insulinase family protein [Cyclobacteriaceae bacterium]|nr:insulinase family protein [Cyclobacteriaceae bacterium]
MLDRTIPPPFIRSNSFDLLTPEKTTLENGLEVFFIRGGEQDVVKIELIFKAGRWFEQTWGAAYFAAHNLTRGTKQKNSFIIAELFDRYGAHVEISPGLDIVSVALYSLSKNLAASLNLIIEILLEASFPEKELAQLKSVYLQNLKINQEKTSFLASALFRKKLFGESHPYGKELEETDIAALVPEQLRAHAHAYFKDVKVFVSGKIDSNNYSLITSRLASLSFSPVEQKSLTPSPLDKFELYQEKEGSVQASIRMGRKSVLRTHADYVDVLFMAHILGGYFGSRLMKNIREEKGLTYGIHGSLHALKHESYLIIGADVNKENVSLTQDEIRKELRRLRTEPIDANELDTARNHFIGSLQAEIATPFANADKIKNLNIFNLDSAYYQNMILRIEKITSEDLLRIGDIHFSEDSFSSVAVG